MNRKLEQILEAPMKTILAVHAAFDFCETVEDICAVIRKIPAKYGEFEILEVSEQEGYFMIHNQLVMETETRSQITTHDFYNVKEDLYYDFRR